MSHTRIMEVGKRKMNSTVTLDNEEWKIILIALQMQSNIYNKHKNRGLQDSVNTHLHLRRELNLEIGVSKDDKS